MTKKIKLLASEFYKIFNYYNFDRIKLEQKTKQGNSIYATRFWISKPLKDEQKTELLVKYNNVKLLISQCQYAPEIKNNVILIADKVLYN